ncbi:MAG TPA: ABC transporter ATP-binding protein [Candidatus Anaerostipes avistercoris]|jgi:ABC-2 type transport system ATP-binding protein|uniref:ABC transporter ATP-binding protein n=1 Tax=Candidatus Anaerostipes avistercoris TaxID=2838462 RepID=A0A9D2PI77_9FIRM|nr:ABC transporter ATP-binding protein [Candidatus Anaerostipes avistercoris]
MLEIKNLTKIYPNGKKAVSNLSMTVADGDLCGFIGKNGAGKTTTLKACLTIHDFETGDILLNGLSIKSAPTECKRKMAYVPDTPILETYLTGLQYLNFICDIYEVPTHTRRKRIDYLSNCLGMNNKLNDLISSYSHGMKQKISLIGAFVHKPVLLILDEPFVGLDPEAFIQLKRLMKELCASGGSVLFSSHILDVVEKTCNKIVIIRNGKLIKSGRTEDILGTNDLEEVFMELNGK